MASLSERQPDQPYDYQQLTEQVGIHLANTDYAAIVDLISTENNATVQECQSVNAEDQIKITSTEDMFDSVGALLTSIAGSGTAADALAHFNSTNLLLSQFRSFYVDWIDTYFSLSKLSLRPEFERIDVAHNKKIVDPC